MSPVARGGPVARLCQQMPSFPLYFAVPQSPGPVLLVWEVGEPASASPLFVQQSLVFLHCAQTRSLLHERI